MWDHNETYFLQRNAFWTMVLKMSILIFTCYMRMYIFVIYNWINFIGCENKNCFVLLLFLLFNVQVMEFTSEYKCFYTLIEMHSDIQFEEECPVDGRVDKLKDFNQHQRLSLKKFLV